MSDTWDHIIVGGGSSGCVMASRLSQDPARRVLLLEAGIDLPPGREPATVRDVYPRSYGEPRFMWPQLFAEGAPSGPARPFEQARLMGGGSAIMGMAALRGLPSDFEEWQRAGLESWGWADVLPHYRRLESDLDIGASADHGNQGPIPVRRHAPEQWPPFCAAVDRLLRTRGFGRIDDFNAQFGDGVGAVPMSNLPTQRVSASMAYLDASVRRRANLRIESGAQVLRLLVEQGRVIGAEVAGRAGVVRHIGDETIVCAGAIHTPALLLRSGVGAAAELEAAGVRVHADCAGVGRGLQNHPLVNVAGWLSAPARQPRALRPWPQNALRFSSGLPGTSAGDVFMVILNKTSWHALGARLGSLGVSVYKSYSRGDVSLRGNDPLAMPRVRFNLLADERDRTRLAQAFEMAVDLMHAARREGCIEHVFVPTAGPLIRSLNRPRWSSRARARAIASVLDIHPVLRAQALARAGVDPSVVLGNPALAREWVTRYAVPAGHVCGTCRMGAAADPEAVTDEQGRVRAVGGLRVADASLMPTIVSANTHLTVTMMAEKIAAAMLSGTTNLHTPTTHLEIA